MKLTVGIFLSTRHSSNQKIITKLLMTNDCEMQKLMFYNLQSRWSEHVSKDAGWWSDFKTLRIDKLSCLVSA